MLTIHFALFVRMVSEKKIFRKRATRNKNCQWRPCLLMDRYEIRNVYRKPPIDASYQIVVPLVNRFKKRIEDAQKSTNRKHELPMVVMFINGSERYEQSVQRTFHRCFLQSFVSFDQEVLERKIFRNRATRNKNCLCRLLTDRDNI